MMAGAAMAFSSVSVCGELVDVEVVQAAEGVGVDEGDGSGDECSCSRC